MLCIHLKNPDPYFCLAAEEYLLKNFTEDIFMLWQSTNTVVVGKHQNALAEINYLFVRENQIKVARRISGGGTVFHDAGNVNFTFIKNVKSPSEISFAQFTQPVVVALAKLGVVATTSGRNDLLIEGKKISGNAQHVYKNRVLHHGTLLFDSDLTNLGQAIKVTPGKYKSKAVQSNRSEVVNISDFMESKITVDEYTSFLFQIQSEKLGNQIFELSEYDILQTEKLANEKFRTWEWNFGYSPVYTFENSDEIEGKTLGIKLKVERGIIVDAELMGDYFTEQQSAAIANSLMHKKHDFAGVEGVFKALNFQIEETLLSFFF